MISCLLDDADLLIIFKVKGLAFFFNPTGENLEQIIEVPLYYTGLISTATIIFEDDQSTEQTLTLRRNYAIEISISKLLFSLST